MSMHERQPRVSESCRAVRAVMSAWIDHELPDAEAARVQRHVRRCPACIRQVEQERAMVTAVRRVGMRATRAERAPASLRARVAQMLDAAMDAAPAARD